MEVEKLLKKLKGIQTIDTIMDLLKANRRKAIYELNKLRKEGYVKTKRLSDNKRVYDISFENRLKGISYIDIINENSPIKIATTKTYQIHGKKPSVEETIIYAIETQSLRTILAALSLFRKIKNWSELYQLAKKNNSERKIGVLHDLCREIMLTRKMTKRYRNNSLPKEKSKWEYIIPKLKSDDFKGIEKTWKIYIPFNKKDLEVYKK